MCKKTYQDYGPRQRLLMPPAPTDWLPEDHLAYFILDVVEHLDLSAIYAHYEREGRGYPPYHPQMMVGLLLYGYCVGVSSSRRIERGTYEDVAFRVLAAGHHPDHSRINAFRQTHLAVLSRLFAEVLELCQKAGMVKLGHVAVDGTKQKANASLHKAMSYGRMKADKKRLQAIVKELLDRAAAVDEEEDRLYGKDKRGDELPEDLRHAETRLARIKQLKKEIEEEAKAQREAEEKAKAKKEEEEKKGESEAEAKACPELPTHKIPREETGKPTDKAQRNFTDPDSRVMKTANGYIQGYNCQLAVDEHRQVIVAQAVTNQCPDYEHLPAMLTQVRDNCGAVPKKLTADSGYFCETNVTFAEDMGVDPYFAVGRQKHAEDVPPERGRMKRDLRPKERMRRKVGTKRGARIYARRKVTAEPPFGQIKEARGLRRFLLRGLEKVRAEWSLVALTHNLLKLYRELTGRCERLEAITCPA